MVELIFECRCHRCVYASAVIGEAFTLHVQPWNHLDQNGLFLLVLYALAWGFHRFGYVYLVGLFSQIGAVGTLAALFFIRYLYSSVKLE